MTRDIFDNVILCNGCGKKMQRATVLKNGFLLRAVMCDKCGDKIIHPADEAEFLRFSELKNKIFKVKLRVVGNSYAVSIPKEVVSFIKEQERIFDDIVNLFFEDSNRLTLQFGKDHEINHMEKTKL